MAKERSFKRMVRAMIITTNLIINHEGKSESYKRTVKTRMIQKMIREVEDEFNIQLIKLTDNVYITSKRHNINKIRRLAAYLRENYEGIEIYIVRKLGVKDLAEVFAEETSEVERINQLPGIKELARQLLEEAKKRERSWRKATSYEWWDKLVILLEILSKS